MVEILNDFADKHGIIALVLPPHPHEPFDKSLSKTEKPRKNAVSGLSFVPFVSSDIKKRTDPDANLPGVKSIIVIGVRSSRKDADSREVGSSRGSSASSFALLSSLGVDDDYHVRVRGLLRKLVDELKAHTHGTFKYKILVDSPTLDERALAFRAGLGFFGRNGLIISQKFGSRFNIGCLLTDIPLPGDFSAASSAASAACPPGCDLCIAACPTGALKNYENDGTGGLNAARCISYLTQKDKLSPEEEKLMGKQLYGCDICQNVCPFNRPGAKHAPSAPEAAIDPREWLEMTDEDFRQKYGHTAMLWRGAEMLRRNARIVRGNSLK